MHEGERLQPDGLTESVGHGGHPRRAGHSGNCSLGGRDGRRFAGQAWVTTNFRHRYRVSDLAVTAPGLNAGAAVGRKREGCRQVLPFGSLFPNVRGDR